MLKVAYDGTGYHGYQIQDGCATIEGELNKNCATWEKYDIVFKKTDFGEDEAVKIYNLINKIWFRTDDILTIEEAQKQLGKEDKIKTSKNISENAKETKYIYETRNAAANGHETIDTDASVLAEKAGDLTCERYVLSKGKLQIELLDNLDKIAPVGALIIAAWPRIENATGMPVRAFAITPKKRL